MKSLCLALYFLVGLLLGTVAVFSHAGTYQSYQGSAFRTINGTTYWKGDAGTFAQSKATVIESIKVGGTYITVPTVAQVTGAMVGVAAGAVRMSPGLAGVSLISWLASQGLELVNGEWKKLVPGDSIPVSTSGAPTCGQMVVDGPEKLVQIGNQVRAFKLFRCQKNVVSPPAGWDNHTWCNSDSVQYPDCGGYSHPLVSQVRQETCPLGYTFDPGTSSCVSPSRYEPAGQSDWDKVNGVTPPDQVMKEMCQALAKYNTSTPGCAMYNAKTEKATVAMSDWAPNPTTGNDERQVATWTPRPTPDDPFAGEVSINTESKPTDSPVDPETGEPVNPGDKSSTDKTSQTPFCTLYPDSLACAKFGQAEDPAKLVDTKQVSITPDSGFGPSDGQCPQDLIYTLHLTGTQVRFSYQPVCTGIRTFRPVIIGMAWISGVLIFLGITRKAQG